MTEITIFDISDIEIGTKFGLCEIKLKYNNSSSITKIIIDEKDARYLVEQLEYSYHGNTHDELKTRLENRIAELKEEIKALREENAALRLGEVSYSMREF